MWRHILISSSALFYLSRKRRDININEVCLHESVLFLIGFSKTLIQSTDFSKRAQVSCCRLHTVWLIKVVLLYQTAFIHLFLFLFLGSFAKLRKATISFVTSVCLSVRLSALNDLALTKRILMTFYI